MIKSSKNKAHKTIWIVIACLIMLAIIAIVLFFTLKYEGGDCDAVCYANKGLESYNQGEYRRAEKYFNEAIKADNKLNGSIDNSKLIEIITALADMYSFEKGSTWNSRFKTGENNDYYKNNSDFYKYIVLYANKSLEFLQGEDGDIKDTAYSIAKLLTSLSTYDPFAERDLAKYILSTLGGKASKKLRHMLYLVIYEANERILNLDNGYNKQQENTSKNYKYTKEMLDMMTYDTFLNDGVSWSLCRKGFAELRMGDYLNSALDLDKCVIAINDGSILDNAGNILDLSNASYKERVYYDLYWSYYMLGQNSQGPIVTHEYFINAEETAKAYIDFCNENSSKISCDYNSAYYIRGDACRKNGKVRMEGFGECASIWKEGISLGYDTDGSMLKAYQGY